MTRESIAAPSRPNIRKMILQSIVGAVCGAIVTYLALQLVEGRGFDLDDPSRVAALGVGLVFLLMGTIVGLGVALPGPGAHLLNVEDADELREQRRPLWRSALVILLIGAMMTAFALAPGPDWVGLVSRQAAAIALAVTVVASTSLSFLGHKDQDELMRAIAREGSAWGFYASLAIFVVWGGLAHLGFVAWITPLGMVSALLAIMLAAIFIVCGVRGVLTPR